jgi:hypothetical protein
MEQQHPTKRHFISSRKKVEPFAHYEYAEFDFWSLGLSRLPVPASTRDRQTQRFRRLQVNDESELGRLFNGQIPRIGAFKNPVHVIHGAAKGRGQAGAVCHQTSGFRGILGRERLLAVDFCREFDDTHLVDQERSVCEGDDRAWRIVRHGVESQFEIGSAAHVECLTLETSGLATACVSAEYRGT